MINAVDISSFFTWFIQNVTNIAGNIFTQLDNITWAGFSLLDFIIAIALLTIFLEIVIIAPRKAGNTIANRMERKNK